MLLPLYVHAKNLTMAVNKQLQNMVFLQTKVTYNHFIVQCNSSFPSAIGPLSRFTKIISNFLNCNEFCTDEGRGDTLREHWQVKQV